MSSQTPHTRPVSAEDLIGDLVSRGDPLFGTVWINPQRMSGTPCFYGTRVPVKNLFDGLAHGGTIDDFLLDYPGVTRLQVETVLRASVDAFSARSHKGRAA